MHTLIMHEYLLETVDDQNHVCRRLQRKELREQKNTLQGSKCQMLERRAI